MMKLFYRKYGNGPALIILHGLFGSSDNWVTIAKKITDKFTVYLPDLRNHGNSPHSDEQDYNLMRDDLHELVTDLNLKKFFLAGHSMGGKVAISFAIRWPEMLQGLLVADISAFGDKFTSQVAYNQHISILKTILSTDLSGLTSRNEVESLLGNEIKSERIRGLIMKNMQRNDGNEFVWKINAASILSNLDKIMEGIDRPSAFPQQITGFPVIFLRGAESDYLPIEDYADIKKIFPVVEFTEIPGAGHWIQADKPDDVADNLLRLTEM
jgi:pimeloyl-ACP methyl ester carboxylesterase